MPRADDDDDVPKVLRPILLHFLRKSLDGLLSHLPNVRLKARDVRGVGRLDLHDVTLELVHGLELAPELVHLVSEALVLSF